jgi:hypothetical protein
MAKVSVKKLSQAEFDTVDEKRVAQAIEAAQKKLWDSDKRLLELDAHERSICFRFAVYLAEQFPEFDVDCEYNRNHDEDDYLKRLKDENLYDIVGREPRFGDEDGLMIMPDVIVHIRDEPMNLLVIEVKKTSSAIPEHKDLFKLNALKKELGYRFARFIKFDVGDNCQARGVSESFFI